MSAEDDDDRSGPFASPPCLMHELDPAFAGLAEGVDPQQWADVMRWRKAERDRLITARLAVPARIRQEHDRHIKDRLKELIKEAPGPVVSAYWPFRGEPDLRNLLEEVIASGGRAALPVVVARQAPLIFRAWTPGERLERGVWNIPIPPESSESLIPDVVIAPVVGFDPACYRLGYGGGFFDRTLAALPARPYVIGVGYSLSALSTIYPQPHDVPLDVIITEQGIAARRAGAPGLQSG